jgi:phosphohistidine phosphatase
MRCFFLRHGIAVEPDEWQGSDFDRPLTGEGRTRMEREAAAIGELSLGIERIVTSPLLRARQTAEILADRLELRGGLVVDERLGLGFDRRRLKEILAAHDGVSVVLVGHEPSMSATIGSAIGDASIDLKKAALACVDLPDRASAGTLVFLIPPKVLVALGRHC